jgi:hypothetical protein
MLGGAAQSTWTMADNANTWQAGTLTFKNPSAHPQEVRVRVRATNASGNAWATVVRTLAAFSPLDNPLLMRRAA